MTVEKLKEFLDLYNSKAEIKFRLAGKQIVLNGMYDDNMSGGIIIEFGTMESEEPKRREDDGDRTAG